MSEGACNSEKRPLLFLFQLHYFHCSHIPQVRYMYTWIYIYVIVILPFVTIKHMQFHVVWWSCCIIYKGITLPKHNAMPENWTHILRYTNLAFYHEAVKPLFFTIQTPTFITVDDDSVKKVYIMTETRTHDLQHTNPALHP